jgi:hypothetical protein
MVEQVEAAVQAGERRVHELQEEHKMRRDAERIASLEAHCQWLATRVTELQQLVDAMQRGLAARHPK